MQLYNDPMIYLKSYLFGCAELLLENWGYAIQFQVSGSSEVLNHSAIFHFFLNLWLCQCEMKIWFLVINSKVKLILCYISILDGCMILFWSPKACWAWIVLWQCSASCGKGDRARYVSCRDAHGGIADESFCAHLPRPAEFSSCFSPCGEWQVGNWSPVSIVIFNVSI